MFTGIVQHVGKVLRTEATSAGRRLVLDVGPLAEGLRLGDSVAVNGACLTASTIDRSAVGFDAVAETLARTGLGKLAGGAPANLERALRVGDGLDGHIVQGHVDGLARLTRIDRRGGQWNLHFACDQQLTDEMVAKGSVALDGVSLTLVDVADGRFSVTIIPTTLAATTLGRRAAGDEVNVETDILGKYVRKLLSKGGRSGGVTMETLKQAGFM